MGRPWAQPGACSIGDRYYSYDYKRRGELLARGVALQDYLALIAVQLLLLHPGRRPTKRQMEAIQFDLPGWCSVAELVARVGWAAAKKN